MVKWLLDTWTSGKLGKVGNRSICGQSGLEDALILIYPTSMVIETILNFEIMI